MCFQVNNKRETIPYFYSKENGHKVDFIFIDHTDPTTKQNLRLETSFGLKISTTIGGAVLSMDIPRHPELRGNTGGVLGKWNDNPADDNLDPEGKPLIHWTILFRGPSVTVGSFPVLKSHRKLK